MKVLVVFLFAVLLLSACAPAIVQQAEAPTIIPPGEAGGPPVNTPASGGVKVVTLVAETPTLTGAGETPTRVPTAPAATATAAPQPPKSLADLGISAVTYQDKIAHLAFDYPADWNITDLADEQKQNAYVYNISLRSVVPTRGPKQQDGIPPGMAAIDVGITMKDGPKTLTQAINERRAAVAQSENGPVLIKVEEDWTLPSGLAAHYFLLDVGSDPASGARQYSSQVVTMIDGHMVLLNGFGDQTLFRSVAASVREAK